MLVIVGKSLFPNFFIQIKIVLSQSNIKQHHGGKTYHGTDG